MNESTIKEIANQQTPLYTALFGFVSKINFINIGVITRVHDENYVDVNLYYKSSTGKKVQIQAVRLLHIGTTKCKLLLTPAVGDNVLLLCPKDLIETIEYNKAPEKSEITYLPYGNLNMCGILIKDESDDNVKTSIGINENGDISVITDGEVNVENKGNVSVKTTGNISVQCVKDDENETVRATVTVGSNGNISVNSEDEITVSSKKNLSVTTEKDAIVNAEKITAICSTFSVKGSKNGPAVFEVTP